MTESVARLRGDQLTLGYGKYTVAENLNVSIPDGHFTAIIGPNGCGKSTLLRTLSRLMSPVHGHVWLDGEHIQHYASKEVARRIGLLAQRRRRRRRRCDARHGDYPPGDAKRGHAFRRAAAASMDSNGAGAGNIHHVAG